jgi:hypothetical protein
MIAGDGTASELLDRAYNAHIHEDGETWGRLPLRYGPYAEELPDILRALEDFAR